MFVKTDLGLGQTTSKQISEGRLLKQLLENGLDIQTEIDGRKLHIKWDPGVAEAPYLPKRHPESQDYWALPGDERAKVASTTTKFSNRQQESLANLIRRTLRINPGFEPG